MYCQSFKFAPYLNIFFNVLSLLFEFFKINRTFCLNYSFLVGIIFEVDFLQFLSPKFFKIIFLLINYLKSYPWECFFEFTYDKKVKSLLETEEQSRFFMLFKFFTKEKLDYSIFYYSSKGKCWDISDFSRFLKPLGVLLSILID